MKTRSTSAVATDAHILAAEITKSMICNDALIASADALFHLGRYAESSRIYRACGLMLWARAVESLQVIRFDDLFSADARAIAGAM